MLILVIKPRITQFKHEDDTFIKILINFQISIYRKSQMKFSKQLTEIIKPMQAHYKKPALERPPKTDAKYQKTDATSI
jgi:hypothetical protein